MFLVDVIRCLFVIDCYLIIVCVGRCLVFGVVLSLLLVVDYVSCVVSWLSFDGRCSLVVVWCFLFVI